MVVTLILSRPRKGPCTNHRRTAAKIQKKRHTRNIEKFYRNRNHQTLKLMARKYKK